MAASTGQTEKFEKIFESEDEKNPCNAEGYTPFLLAARKGHFQICDFALQKVKDLNIDLGKNLFDYLIILIQTRRNGWDFFQPMIAETCHIKFLENKLSGS